MLQQLMLADQATVWDLITAHLKNGVGSTASATRSSSAPPN